MTVAKLQWMGGQTRVNTVNLKCLIPKRPAVTFFQCVTSLGFQHRSVQSINTMYTKYKHLGV